MRHLVGMGFRIGAVCAAFLFAFEAQAAVFSPTVYTLANGMRLIVVEGALSNTVCLTLWIKAGAADDPRGKSGLAHYLEHMMFKSGKELPAGSFSSQIAEFGGRDNAFTGHDSTAYYTLFAAEHLGEVMVMEAARLRGLVFDNDEALRERDVVLSERQERTDNDPYGIFHEKMRAALFGAHPYGRPVIGKRAEIGAISPEDAKAFYDRHYGPENIVLVVAGDVLAHNTAALASAVFGSLGSFGPPRAVSALALFEESEETSLVMEDSRIHQPLWTRKILVPSFRQNPAQASALELLAEILAGGEVGLLYRHFVMGEKSAAFVSASVDTISRGPAGFALSATSAAGTDIHELGKDIKEYLAALAQKGISKSALEKAKKRLLDGAVFARDDMMAPSLVLGGAAAAGLFVSEVEGWPERVRAVSVPQVNESLRALLREKRAIEGVLRGKKEGEKAP